MKYKSRKVKKQFIYDVNPLMCAIVEDADRYAYAMFGHGLFLTRCLDRIKVGKESGVHWSGRGVDARCEYVANGESIWYFSKEQADNIVAYINEKYMRTDGLPTAMLHPSVGPDGEKGPYHFHFQLAWNVGVYHRKESNAHS